jgi:hypothetical protein
MRCAGHQQLSLFNAPYNERCFLPIHIYEGVSGTPVAMILREGKTPSGKEVRTILKHVIARIRSQWPKVRILVRGDSHYGRHEAMEWCESQEIDYVFGFGGGDAVLDAMVREPRRPLRGIAPCRQRRSGAVSRSCAPAPRAGGCEPPSDASRPTTKGLDIRYIVTSLTGAARHLDKTVYCARGEAENFIKLPQGTARLRPHLLPQSARQPVPSDPAHRRPLAHARVRNAVPKRPQLFRAEFATLRLNLIKIAARVVEAAARIRISLPSACPHAALFRFLAGRFAAAGP